MRTSFLLSSLFLSFTLASIAQEHMLQQSDVVFRIPDGMLDPENIAYDVVDQLFYVGSALKRKIVKIDKTGFISDFTGEMQDGLWSVLGMKVDATRRVLWVASSAHQGMKGFTDQDGGRTGIFKYDLSTGKYVKKYLPDPSVRHAFNDLVVTSTGDLLATDSESATVYAISPHRDELEIWFSSPSISQPDGITLSRDEKKVFVAHAAGVSVIDRASKTLSMLNESESLSGLNGIYYFGNSLIAIQPSGQSVSRAYLSGGLDKVDSIRVVEPRNDFLNRPTSGVMVGRTLYYIGNSPYSFFEKKSETGSTYDGGGIAILRMRLR